MNAEDRESHQCFFAIRLLMQHPQMDIGAYMSELGIQPHLNQVAGTPRITPTGTPLLGNYEKSTWSVSYDISDQRNFMKTASTLIEDLLPHSSLLGRFISSSGQIEIILHLPGRMNIGDTLSHHNIQKLALLKIDLGIEVFPDWAVRK